MEIKDKKLAKMVSASGSNVLISRIATYPEEEWDKEEHPTETALVLNIAEEVMEDYADDGHCLHEELWWAKKVDKERNRFLANIHTMQMRPMHSAKDIESADAVLAEYNATRAIIKKLRRTMK